MSSVYFNNKKLPAPKREYVAFMSFTNQTFRDRKDKAERNKWTYQS